MRTAVMAAALAGLATGAVGQNISTGLVVSLTFDRTSVGVGETFNASIYASWNGVAGSYFSSINVDLIASGNFATVNSVDPIAWNNPALGFTGSPASIDGASIMGLQASQFSLIPPFVNTNPILVTRFNLTYTAEGTLSYSVQAAAGSPFPFSVTGPAFSDPVVQFGSEVFQSASIGFPAPGAVGLLGMAGVVAGRRRR
jgi:MYXO-CTERM domain-containing protein